MASAAGAGHSAGRRATGFEGERSATGAGPMLTHRLTRPACDPDIESDFEPDYGSGDSDSGKEDQPEVI